MSRRSLAALAVAPLVATVPAFGQEAAPVGQVVRQTGLVTIIRDGRPRPLLLGAQVFPTDMIVVGPDAQLMIEFVDGSTVVFGADCQAMVADYAVDPDGGRWSRLISLLAGILRATVQPADRGRFEIRTETAVASARSTDWLVDAADRTTAVFVVEGSVSVAGTTGAAPVVLGPGDGTDVAAGQAPTAPKRWGAERVERALARVRLP